MKKQRTIVLSTLFSSILLASIGTALTFSNVTNTSNSNYKNDVLSLNAWYNTNLSRDEIIENLFDASSKNKNIYKDYLGAFVDLSFFPYDTNYIYMEDRVDYENSELILSFMSDKYFDQDNKIINEWQEYTVEIKIKLPEVTNLSSRKDYNQNLTKYEVLDNLTGGYDSTDEIISTELMQYINLNTFPKGSKFNIIYAKQHYDKDLLEVGFESDSYYDVSGKVVNKNKSFSFFIEAAMSRATKIVQNFKYSEEVRTLDEIRNFLLKNPRKSNEINIKNLSKYLIINNINEHTKFYLDNISLKHGLGGFVNIEISYDNYLDNAGKNVNSTRTFEFMVLTFVDPNSTSMYRNKNKVNSRGYKSTLNFLKGDISGEDVSEEFKTLDRTAISQWFTLRNVPKDAVFTLNKYEYAKDNQGQTDKKNVEIEFSVNEIMDNKGDVKPVEALNSETENQEEHVDNPTYQSICKGTIPIHIENTTTSATGITTADLTVYELKNSLLVKDQMMSYSAIKKYMTIDDIPLGTKFLFESIAKKDLTTETVETNVKFHMDKWYEDGEIKNVKKPLELKINSNRSYQTSITTNQNYRKAINKTYFENKLLEGSPGNRQVNANTDFFKEYFNLTSASVPTIILESIEEQGDALGGTLTVNFLLNNANDDTGAPLDGLRISPIIEFQNLFNFNSATGTILGLQDGYIQTTTSLEIPSDISGINVVAIAEDAFKNNKKIENITLPPTMTKIGSYAFSGCTSLKMTQGIEIHDDIKNVGVGIFSGLSNTHLTTISVPKHWDDAPDGWISGFSGDNYIVRDRVSTIPKDAIAKTTKTHTSKIATELTGSSETGVIKNTTKFIEYVGEDLVKTFPEATKFSVDGTETPSKLKKELNVSFDKYWDNQGRTKTDKKVLKLAISFDTTALYKYNGNEITGLVNGYSSMSEWNDGHIIIPEHVTSIGEKAFLENKTIKSVDTVGSLETIGMGAFADSNIEKIDLNNVKYVEDYAFTYCLSLTKLENANNLHKVGEAAFYAVLNATDTINIEQVTDLGAGAFSSTFLDVTSLNFLEDFEVIKDSTFQHAKGITKEIKLPNAIEIGNAAFSYAVEMWTDDNGLILDKAEILKENAFSMYGSKIKSISVRDKLENGKVVNLYKNREDWAYQYINWDDDNVIKIDLDRPEKVEFGNDHSATIIGGVMYTWGDNEFGQLGDATTTQRNTPVRVKGGDEGFVNSGIKKISLGKSHTAAISNGDLYMWGNNKDSQLGFKSESGVATFSSVPKKIIKATGNGFAENIPIDEVSIGGNTSFAIQAGVVYSWGSNQFGIVGQNTNDVRVEKPTHLPSTTEFQNKDIVQVEISEKRAALIKKEKMVVSGQEIMTNRAYAFGLNVVNHFGSQYHGTLGTSEKLSDIVLSPKLISDNRNKNIEKIKVGSEFTMMIHNTGSGKRILGNGQNFNYQLGIGDYSNEPKSELSYVGKLDNVQDISLGGHFAIALQENKIYAWGYAGQGSLGQELNGSQGEPLLIPNTISFTNHNITKITSGWRHSGAIQGTKIFTWGDNSKGQLGNNSSNSNSTYNASPTEISQGEIASSGRISNTLINGSHGRDTNNNKKKRE
ncbi:MAG: leucine-rich repeat protein [Mycoplasma sp.]